jgi:altronate dehydratase small subunit
MANTINAILIHETDNVATAIIELYKGDAGCYSANGQIVEIVIVESIPKYHKFAVRDIRKAELVCKYGNVIGQAIYDIPQGSHVHVHNIISPAMGSEAL